MPLTIVNFTSLTPLEVENSNVFKHVAVAENQIFVIRDNQEVYFFF